MIWIIAIICATPDTIIAEEIERQLANNESIVICSPFGKEPDSDATLLYTK